MGLENSTAAAARAAGHAQRKQRRRPQQQQTSKRYPVNGDRGAIAATAVTAGANWKNSSLKHDRKQQQQQQTAASKPGKQQRRHAAKKVSSKPRDSKRTHVAVASSSGSKVRRQNGCAFPRGKQRLAAPHATEQESPPHRADPPSPTSSLDEEIEAFVRLVSLTPKERAHRLRVFSEMRELICGTFQSATVQLYGSSSNGLDTFRSDLDITVGNVTLNSSLRSDVHSSMEANALGANDPASDDEEEDEDYEDERYHDAPRAVAPQALQPAAEREEPDDEPSFSLNIATPQSKRSASGAWSQPLAATKSPWNPTLRRKKIRVLRALQFLLKVKRPQLQVKCLQKAKIPILMVLDPASQLSLDIGVNREAFEASDHGRTTSLVIELQQVLGRAFTVLVTFLKEFLHQFELDKPFTGGLGSFRLYIMVASLFPLEKSAANGGGGGNGVRLSKRVPPVSTLLRTFFQVFGNKRKPNYLQSSTVLKLPFADSTVDFATVFRLDDCVDAFAMAFDILTKTNSLGAIIFEDRLADEREQVCRATTAQAGSQPSKSVRAVRPNRR